MLIHHKTIAICIVVCQRKHFLSDLCEKDENKHDFTKMVTNREMT